MMGNIKITGLIGRSIRRGFTLVEMLIVGVLIALFSGLAVFSISQQLNSNKMKAAVAECRQISTAMSFAHQDLGFFPKICYLRLSANNLAKVFTNFALSTQGTKTSIHEWEYHSLPTAMDLTGKLLDKKWKGPYGGFGQERIVRMTIPAETGGRDVEMDWPADPWGNPYVAYFITTERRAGAGVSDLTNRFIKTAGEDARLYAGVVSYGRNKVPGMVAPGEDPKGPDGQSLFDPPDYNSRKNLRQYTDGAGHNKYVMLRAEDFQNPGESSAVEKDRVRMIQIDEQSRASAKEQPRIRDPHSDDRFIEF